MLGFSFIHVTVFIIVHDIAKFTCWRLYKIVVEKVLELTEFLHIGDM